jgi:hypothetical protein
VVDGCLSCLGVALSAGGRPPSRRRGYFPTGSVMLLTTLLAVDNADCNVS